jgi:alpha-tubulin suppressor-like RCC1 family protein
VNAPPSGTYASFSIGAVNETDHGCALDAAGAMTCWGNSSYGQGTAQSGSWSQVSAGDQHSCAISTAGAVSCWGDNISGETADPAGNWSQVSAGNQISCGVTTAGAASCWGTLSTSFSGSYTAVIAASDTACALSTTGSVSCAGYYPSATTPPTGSYQMIASGDRFHCALDTAGTTITCWGMAPTSTLTAPSGTTFVSMAGGSGHFCAVDSHGGVTCEGDDLYGQSSLFNWDDPCADTSDSGWYGNCYWR